jgi:cytosine/adenosine deaminase-related metal-dependent hydrolase
MEGTSEWSGRAFIGESLEERDVRITVRDGMIVSIEELSRPEPRWICPCFFNAHTHLGDTVAMDVPVSGSLAELVAPPHGLKHRILASTPRDVLVDGMKASIASMQASGTAGFADFREGGEDGVRALKEALEGAGCQAVIFGREGGEAIADGMGISSVREGGPIEERVRHARRLGRLVAFHAGEKDAKDVDEALLYDPDLLVHCTHATRDQLRRIADAGVAVAVCPRSNWVLGVAQSAAHPPIALMRELGITVLLGTDNVMFVQPDMFQEMAFTADIYRMEPAEVLAMAIAGSKTFFRPFFIEERNPAKFFVLDPMRGNARFSKKPIRTIVKRMNPGYIEKNII